MPHLSPTRSFTDNAPAAATRLAVLACALGCLACGSRAEQSSETTQARTGESEPHATSARTDEPSPGAEPSAGPSDFGAPVSPADAESERLCRLLESERLDERVEATDQLLDRYVGPVTGGTEDQMSAAAAYCREHHAPETGTGGCTVQNDTTEPLELVATALDDAPLGTLAPGATMTLGGHFAARQGSREARGFCAEGQALRIVRRGARLTVADAP